MKSHLLIVFAVLVSSFLSPDSASAQASAGSTTSKSWVANLWETTTAKTSEALDAAQKSKAWEATKEKSGEIWKATKEKSAEAWQATKQKSGEAWEAAKNSDAWKATKDKSGEAWEATKNETSKFYTEHEESINTVTAITIAAGAAYLESKGSSSEPSLNGQRNLYENLRDPANVAPGKLFSPAQRQLILQENLNRNGGVLRSDASGTVLTPASQYTQGYTPLVNEAQVDHIFPRAAGGTNSFSNAQVLSRQENLEKGATFGDRAK